MSALITYPLFKAFDDNGNPLNAGKLYTYEVGTTTAKTTYSDYDLSTPNANPVILNSRGEATIYSEGATKLVLKNSSDVTIWTADNVGSSFLATLDDDATPSVLGRRYFVTGGTTTITNFDDGEYGQEILIIAEHSVTITDGASIVLKNSRNYDMLAGDTLTLLFNDDDVWYEMARSVNSFEVDPIITLADDATPSVLNDSLFLTGGTTTITDFDDGVTGQIIKIIAEHSLTITDGTNIFLNGSANFDMVATDTLTLICKADNKWYELARSDNT